MTHLPLPLASRAPAYVSVTAMEEWTIQALRRLWRAGHRDEAGLLMCMGDWWVELGLIGGRS
jgi:hypothetical protein